jgi:integrase
LAESLLSLTRTNRIPLGGLLDDYQKLLLDDDVPHLDLAREKRGRVQRIIYLYPTTVAALRAYRDSLPKEQRTGLAFPCQGKFNHNRAISVDGIRRAFDEFKRRAKVAACWHYKHLRNVAPNVRMAEKMTVDTSWAILGQNKLGELAKYEYTEPDRLKPLVDAIAKRYF